VVATLAVLGPALFVGVKCYSSTSSARAAASVVQGIPTYSRAESLTYLTLPEWFIVFSADEYAAFIGRQPPTRFPYLGSIKQYWGYYSAACGETKGAYPFDTDYHVMLAIIGASFTIENVAKSVYENTIGRATEWLATADTPEDDFARRTAKEYGGFMPTVPWYQFPFASKTAALWRDTPLRGPHMVRKLERRVALTAEYGIKAVYGWVITKASGAAYGAEDLRIFARIADVPRSALTDTRITYVKQLDAVGHIVTLPRYEEFTKVVLAMTAKGVRFLDIAGNDEILVTVLARRGVPTSVPKGRLVAVLPILTDHTMQRFAVSVPVTALREVAAHVAAQHATIEHVYDY
jgi:hypothetical protein